MFKISTNLPLNLRCVQIHRFKFLSYYIYQLHNHRYISNKLSQDTIVIIRLTESIAQSRTNIRSHYTTITRRISKLTRTPSTFIKSSTLLQSKGRKKSVLKCTIDVIFISNILYFRKNKYYQNH